jgi:hypothetical protein
MIKEIKGKQLSMMKDKGLLYRQKSPSSFEGLHEKLFETSYKTL